MAQITWRNINAPELGGAVAANESAARLLNQGLDGFKNIIDNRVATREGDIANLDQQGQAAILQQMAAFQTPEELATATQSGLLDSIMAGMTGKGQIGAQAQIAGKADTLLDQSIRKRDQELREEDQRLRRDKFDKVDLQKEFREAKKHSIEITSLEQAQEFMKEFDSLEVARQKQEQVGNLTNQMFPIETHSHLYTNSGKLDISKLSIEDSKAYKAGLEEIEINETMRQLQIESRINQIPDAGIREQTRQAYAIQRKIETDGIELSKRVEQTESTNWILRNNGINNLFIRAEKEFLDSGGVPLADRVFGDGGLLSDKYFDENGVSKHIRDLVLQAVSTESVRINGVDVPMTETLLRTAIQATKEFGWASAHTTGMTGESFIQKAIERSIGKDNSTDMRTQYDEYKSYMSQVRSKNSFSLGSAVNKATSSVDAHILNLKREATEIANKNNNNAISSDPLNEAAPKVAISTPTERARQNTNELIDRVFAPVSNRTGRGSGAGKGGPNIDRIAQEIFHSNTPAGDTRSGRGSSVYRDARKAFVDEFKTIAESSDPASLYEFVQEKFNLK